MTANPSKSPRVRVAGLADLDRVTEAYQAACADEAVTHWVFSAGGGSEEAEAVVEDALGGAVRGDDEIVVAESVEGRIHGVSTWSTLESAAGMHEQAAELAHLARCQPQPALRRLAAVLASTARRHPDVPHLYLSSMGVLPSARGSGVGSALLRHRLVSADAKGQLAYLEASTDRSAALYLRHGFRFVGEPIEFGDGGPTLRPMWRLPDGSQGCWQR